MPTPHTSNPAQGVEYGHTPGPWKAHGGEIAALPENRSFGGPIRTYWRPVADLSNWDVDDFARSDEAQYVERINGRQGINARLPGWKEVESNAALIALAPDLLRERDQLRAQLAAERAIKAELVAAIEDLMPLLDADILAVETWREETEAARAALARAKEVQL